MTLFAPTRIQIFTILPHVVNEPELEVLKTVNALYRDGYVTLSRIVPLSPENSDSCRYSATGKQYSGD